MTAPSSALKLSLIHICIKPCIEVHNGQMGVAKKYRGAYEKALRNYVRERLEGNDTLRTHRIMITHTPVDDGIVDMVRDEILQYQPFAEVLPTDARGTISCHCLLYTSNQGS